MQNKEIKAGLGYTIGNVLIKGITFLSLPIFTRILSTDEFGIYNTYISYEAIIAIILCLGLEGTIKNGYYDYRDRFPTYMRTLTFLTLIPFTCVLVMAIIANNVLNSSFLPTWVLILLVLHSYGEGMLRINNVYLSLTYRYKIYLGYAFFNTFINIVISLLLVITIFKDQREFGRIVGSSIPMILIGVHIFWSMTRNVEGEFDRRIARYALGISLPLVVHYLSQIVLNQIDRIMITNISGEMFTGIYSFTYNIASIFQIVGYSLDNVWSVWAFKKMDEMSYDELRKTSYKYMILLGFIAISLLTVSDELIAIMAPSSYWDGRKLMFSLVAGIYALLLYTIPAGVEYYYKKTKYIAMLTSVAAVLNCVTNYFFISKYGYSAAAYTTLICYVFMMFGHLIVSRKICKDSNVEVIYRCKPYIIALVIVIAYGVLLNILQPLIWVKYSLYLLFLFTLAWYERNTIQNIIKKWRKNNEQSQ